MFGVLKKVKEFFVGVPEVPKVYEEKRDYTATPIATYTSQIANTTVAGPAKVETEVVQEAVAAVEETPKKKRAPKKAAPVKGKSATAKGKKAKV